MEDTKLFSDSLDTAIVTSIEEMTFETVEIEETLGAVDATFGDGLWASLAIQAPLSGELRLAISKTHARKLAENMYRAKDLPDRLVLDMLAEVLNTVAGSFLKRIVPDDQQFKLGLPQTGTGPTPNEDTPAKRIKVQVGGQYLLIALLGNDFHDFQPIKVRNSE